MTISETIGDWKPKPLQVLALLIALQLFATLFTDGFTLSFDEAMWHYIGRNWFRNGLAPYTGGVDNKSPIIFAIFGLSDKLFGVNYWFPRVLGTACQAIGIFYVYKIARHLSGERAGLLAMSFYGLSLLWHATGGKYVSYTETYDVLFIIIAVYHYLVAKNNKQILIAGLLAGVALAFRLTGAFGILAILISCLLKNRRYALVFCTGAISSIIALAVCCFFAGIKLHDLLTYGLTDNFSSGSATDHTLLWKWHNFSAKFFVSGMLLFYPMVFGYLFIKRKVDLFVLWLALAFIAINAVGIYDVVHLKELLPALSLISAFCINYLLDRYRFSASLTLLIIWIAFFPNLSEQLITAKRQLSNDSNPAHKFCVAPYTIPDEGTRKLLGLWVRDNTSPQDKVYIAGFGAQVQVYSERISPTIYFNVTQTTIAKARFYSDLRSNKPAVILIPLFPEYKQTVGPDMRQFVAEMIAREYELDRCLDDYGVYRIRK
ncbi:MAG: ArnT family glycosyltransferase [Mucilaginibacter sp.]